MKKCHITVKDCGWGQRWSTFKQHLKLLECNDPGGNSFLGNAIFLWRAITAKPWELSPYAWCLRVDPPDSTQHTLSHTNVSWCHFFVLSSKQTFWEGILRTANSFIIRSITYHISQAVLRGFLGLCSNPSIFNPLVHDDQITVICFMWSRVNGELQLWPLFLIIWHWSLKCIEAVFKTIFQNKLKQNVCFP